MVPVRCRCLPGIPLTSPQQLERGGGAGARATAGPGGSGISDKVDPDRVVRAGSPCRRSQYKGGGGDAFIPNEGLTATGQAKAGGNGLTDGAGWGPSAATSR